MEPSISPWFSPLVIGIRPSGEPHFCIDFQGVNKITKKDAYNIPNMDSTLDRLCTAQFVSKIDLRNAYHHVPLSGHSKEVALLWYQDEAYFNFD